jgi:hypothetical protein
VKALSSIPFEEAYEIDRGSPTRPVTRVAVSVGGTLVAVWMSPLIMALSAITSGRRDAYADPIPDTGPMRRSTALPSTRAA